MDAKRNLKSCSSVQREDMYPSGVVVKDDECLGFAVDPFELVSVVRYEVHGDQFAKCCGFLFSFPFPFTVSCAVLVGANADLAEWG